MLDLALAGRAAAVVTPKGCGFRTGESGFRCIEILCLGILGNGVSPARVVLLAGLICSMCLLAGCGDGLETSQLDLGVPATPEEISAATAWKQDRSQALRFGFDLRNGPKEDAQQYLPLLNYLQRSTGYRFTLHFTPDVDHLLADLAVGRLQFVAIGAGTYLIASRKAPIVPLVQGVNIAGETGYRATLVVAPDSPIQRVQDLRDRRLAFGSTTSTQGHWIPRIMLRRAGLGLDDLGAYFYTGSHRACAEAVISGRMDACGLQNTLAQHLIQAGSLRKLAVSDIHPSSGVFADARVPEEVRSDVRRSLIEFDPQGRDRAGLYNWEATEMAGGFVAADEEDYESLRVWAERMGLLKTRAGTGTSP